MRQFITYLLVMMSCSTWAQVSPIPTVHERLDRGMVALPAQDRGIFVSWRLLGDDDKDVIFDVVRNGKTIAKGIKATNFTDAEGTSNSSYKIIARQQGKEMTSME